MALPPSAIFALALTTPSRRARRLIVVSVYFSKKRRQSFWQEGKTGHPTLSLKCQLAITLWRLRQGSTLLELSYHFEISLDLLRRITVTWIQFMYKQFDGIRDAMYVTRGIRHSTRPCADSRAVATFGPSSPASSQSILSLRIDSCWSHTPSLP